MSQKVVLYGNLNAVDTKSLADRINDAIKDMNNDEKYARLVATLPQKKRDAMRDIVIAEDAMRGYLRKCETLQKENLELAKKFNSISRFNIFRRKPLYEKINSNTKEILQNLQFFMNAKAQKEALEGSLHNINSLLLDCKPVEDYVQGYRYLAEHEYNPFVFQLNNIAGSNIPLIDPDAEICQVEPIEVINQIDADLEDDYASDNENEN